MVFEFPVISTIKWWSNTRVYLDFLMLTLLTDKMKGFTVKIFKNSLVM